MKSSPLKPSVEAMLAELKSKPARVERSKRVFISTGIPEADLLTGGIPRGAISLVVGPPSSGRTTLMMSTLAVAGTAGEVSALVDASDTFDAASARDAGVDLDRL
ncbi:MAG TPA: recombinase RecA, partial [Blastocatellia bacterium]|nr:recombinase RecA [Blastocatellia bacterium]